MDRISNLPTDVIIYILSFLPIVDMIATGVLSKRWKNLWTKATTLDFILDEESDEDEEGEDEDEDGEGEEDGDGEDEEDGEGDDGEDGSLKDVQVRKFERFVDRVLLHNTSQTLQKFRLKWWEGFGINTEYVSIWMSDAIARNVRVLVIDLGYSDEVYTPWSIDLPGTLFTCATLEILKIYGYMKFHVPSVVCLPKLEVLGLRHVSYESNECITKLVACCPVLSYLKIDTEPCVVSKRDLKLFSPSLRRVKLCSDTDGTCVGKLEIDAPNLEYLHLKDGFERYSVNRLGSVESVVLDLDVFPRSTFLEANAIDGRLCINRGNSIVKLVGSMSSVKFLTVKGTILKALCYATMPLGACFKRLTKLDVWVENWHLSSLGVVLGCCTKLQVLNIGNVTLGRRFGMITHKFRWSDPPEVPECLSCTLRQVSYSCLEGLEEEMQMIGYILLHGVAMDSFLVKSIAKDKYKLLQNLWAFPKGSIACQIHFD